MKDTIISILINTTYQSQKNKTYIIEAKIRALGDGQAVNRGYA